MGIRQSALRSVNLVLPSYDSQQKIAEVLGALDDKISANRQVLSRAASLAEGHFLRSVVGGKAARVGDVMAFHYGKSLPANTRSTGTVPVYGSGGVVGTHNVALVDAPGVIVGRKGSVGVVHWSDSPHFPIDTTFFVAPIEGHVPTEFCYFALRAIDFASMNSDSAVPGLNRTEAMAQPITVPGPDSLVAFTQAVRPLFSLRKALHGENKSLVATRDALLPLLMSGRLTVKGAEERAGEVL
ncbi:hypothetical protein GCM10027579_23690 [Calidifontibacter terrae]